MNKLSDQTSRITGKQTLKLAVMSIISSYDPSWPDPALFPKSREDRGLLIAAGRERTTGSEYVASNHTGNADVIVVVAVTAAEDDDVSRRCFGHIKCGSGQVMVGSRLLWIDAGRTLSSSLSPGMCVYVCVCVCRLCEGVFVVVCVHPCVCLQCWVMFSLWSVCVCVCACACICVCTSICSACVR